MNTDAVTQQKNWNGKPYHSLDHMLRERFGEKVYKVTLNGGMSCPNRDGKLGSRGCIFCSEGGSGDFAPDAVLPIGEQIEEGIRMIRQKTDASKYIAYFQSYTNTYAPVDYLETLFTEAIRHPDVAVLSVATRPDCLPPETVKLLRRLNEEKPVWVELGLQTMHEKTAQYIRRGYPLSCFEQAVNELQRRGIPVIVHTILGLPGEGQEEVFATMDYLNGLSISGIKLQLLHVLKNTDLAADYAAGKFEVLEQDAYLTLVIDCLRRLRPDLVIHRVTGDGPGDLLIAPTWSQAKRTVLNELHHRMKEEHAYQGQLLDEEKGGNTP